MACRVHDLTLVKQLVLGVKNEHDAVQEISITEPQLLAQDLSFTIMRAQATFKAMLSLANWPQLQVKQIDSRVVRHSWFYLMFFPNLHLAKSCVDWPEIVSMKISLHASQQSHTPSPLPTKSDSKEKCKRKSSRMF